MHIQSKFYSAHRQLIRRNRRKHKLALLNKLNQRRCQATPIFGNDGYANCMMTMTNENRLTTLRPFLRTIDERANDIKEYSNSFILYVPKVHACRPQIKVFHPTPSILNAERNLKIRIQSELSVKLRLFHPIVSAMTTQFPETRLIQFDCGKLQTLDALLRNLKRENHRVLIFTQMTKMLDILESFLNYHGHIYLRLDGSTKVDQRQVLMERFNNDQRIFVFILSTRSGGVGINLTGADTVIFYDSDWNPTMDAQAQDRCHRIGQTKDVHIYRLVSEKTIEENILKKANQKRLLGDLAIEGGNFTTAYFKNNTIKDLFLVDRNIDDASTRMSDILEQSKARMNQLSNPEPVMASTSNDKANKSALGALEHAMVNAEDAQDAFAAKSAKAEAVAELAEFDESIPIEDQNESQTPLSKAEQEIQKILDQLNPLEKYAMKFIENSEGGAWSAEQLALAEAEIEEKRLEWEKNRLEQIKQEQKELSERQLEEEKELLTYSRADATNQNWINEFTMEAMPVWSPPTPPQDDNDIYIDHSLNLLYDTAHIMPESQLPPVYVKKESKRIRLDPALSPDGRRPLKFHRKEDIVTVFPRSLFDRPSPALVKLRRDFKLQKYRGIMRPPVPIPGIKPSAPVKATPEPEGVLEWLIYEDWALLQAIQNYQGLPLSLIELTPGHTRNWDLVADLVNNISRVYRSPKQCKNRYESIIVPREEGKLLYDVPKKQKKTKSIIKNPMQSKNNRMMRTSQLFAQDNNSSFTQLLKLRFDNMKAVSIRKSQATKSIFINPTMKNPKHTAVLAECGVTYDAPIVPEDIAQRRIERIAKEKQKLPSSAVVSSGQQSDLSRQQALSKMTGAVPAVNQISQQQNLSAASQSQALPIIPSASSSIAAVQSVSSSPLSVAISQSQIQTCGVQQITTVSTMSQAHAAPQTIAIVSAGITGGQSGGIATLTTASSLRAQRIVAPTNLQEVLQQRANSQSPTVVSVGNLSSTLTQQAQLQARIFASNQQQQAVGAAVSKVVTSNTVTTSRNLTAAQIQLYRQRMNQQARLGLVNAQTQQLVQTAGGTLVQGTAIIQGGLVSASPAIQTSLSGVTGVVQGQKVSVAVTNINTATVVTAAGVQTVQVAQPRTQFIKQVTGKQTIARHMTDSEMAILLSKNKHLLSQQKALAAGGAHTQIFAQAGLQVQQGTAGTAQVTTLVKAGVPVGSTSVTIPVSGLTQVQQKGGMKTAATATPQQIRQLQLQQLALQAQRKGGKVTQIAQVAGKGGLQTQLIVQTPKSLPGVTMQQIQQVIRHVPGGIQTGQVLLGKGGARVIPGTGQPGSRQTIQVVTATSAAQALNNLRNSVGNVQQATSIHGALKVQQSQSIATTSQQQALFSQVSAALSQPVSVSVRQSGGNQVRLQTPLMAVVQQPQQQQQLQQQLQQLQQQQLQQQLQQQQQQQQQQQAQNTSETHQTKK